MAGEADELKQLLDDLANQAASLYPDVDVWDQWLAYLLDGLELQAASLDREHPRAYQAMLARLDETIRARLKKGGR